MKLFEHFSPKELDILRARGERIARLPQQDQPIDTMAALMIQIGTQQYALPIKTLKEVYENVPVVSVPCVPPHIAGIANIRGHIIPVLDLSVLLNAPATESEPCKLVVAANDALTAAFQVEMVGGVTSITPDEIKAYPAGSDRANYFKGLLVNGTGLLDVDSMLSDPSLVVDRKIG